MGNINVLSFEIANLIAAGEVVERPSSVLKELIENSIDAGAHNIVAEIKHGGVSLIRVSDDGCGMDREDLPVSLKRHATSKIRDKDDLSSIMTLGFRGEALAAISSVSMVTIITKTKEAEVGSMLVAEGGKIVDLSDVGTADGTTVVVENLFYNVPARRKFLKKDSTEAMNVAALVEKIALSRPEISMQLLIDGEERFRTPGNGDLLSTIRAIYGKPFASKMIAVDGVGDGIRISGYIGRSDNNRKNRNGENLFINGRYVKSLTAQAAIEQAFTSYMAPECFPVCVLFLDMNPGAVDVNVHPAKLEVKFSDERKVFEITFHAVKNALQGAEYRPDLQIGAKKDPARENPIGAFVPIGADTRGEQISMRAPTVGAERKAFPKEPSFSAPHREEGGAQKPASGANMTPKDSLELLARYADIARTEEERAEKTASPAAPSEPAIPAGEQPEIPAHRIIGEAFDTYVFVELEDHVLVLDKHAAHERVLFEKIKSDRKKDGRIASQELLLPITVLLSPEESAMASDYGDELRSVGYSFSLGDRSADITAIPDLISAEDAEGLFLQMLDELDAGRGNPQNTEQLRRERALYQIACKAAIKGGRVYDPAVIEWLVGQILLLPDITVCPHGRPVAYKITKRELDRQFDRIK